MVVDLSHSKDKELQETVTLVRVIEGLESGTFNNKLLNPINYRL